MTTFHEKVKGKIRFHKLFMTVTDVLLLNQHKKLLDSNSVHRAFSACLFHFDEAGIWQ